MSDEKYLLELGKKIERLASSKYPTQADFSIAAEVGTRTIRRIYRAEQNPTIIVLRKIARALEVDLDQLIKLE
ncbi:helix-turn-helix domain-containing protein [Crocinitomix algicola]|uniref:helix-turn-helix domain-containing protein n=1 Tax=Crocinitomix algicola TaxID=1740263 RepID=UPI0008727EF4|nr:helix-turn-helix transcriptional regulator [Crocinitomix algicola]